MKFHSFLSIACVAAIAVSLSACGTPSSLKTPQGKKLRYPSDRYSKVVVKDFSGRDANVLVNGIPATRQFANRVASQITVRGGFDAVARGGSPDADTLVIAGSVNDSGPSFFSADVYYYSPDGRLLGSVTARKNTMFRVATTENARASEFADETAKKAAEEARKFKKRK